MDNFVNIALNIATEAHKGQKDKAGIDYINHPKTVASFVDTDEEKATALLHDVLEDTDVTAEKLLQEGIPLSVVDAVETLTKIKGISYFDYLEKVKKNPIARIVKLADLKHNSDLTRLLQPTDDDYKRALKYEQAMEFLRNEG